MSRASFNRRQFIAYSAASGLLPTIVGSSVASAKPASPVERLGIGAIGLRYQGSVITEKALPYGDVVAVCDVDRHVREQARSAWGGKARLFEDYRDLLQRPDVDVIMIGTPDHWHTKMIIDACRAGKDIYCEKPLTLTVDEGKQLCRVVHETGRVVQVGTWQRSDVRFREACELVRSGRLGDVYKAIVTIDANPAGGPFENTPQPKHINWDLWLGQAPKVPFCEERGHYTFRWWYEYSGGKMTDWGAHHVDIAQWGLGHEHSGPTSIVTEATHPNVANGYNTPTYFHADLTYADGKQMEVRCQGPVGVRFEGERGSITVSRGTITADPPELLQDTLPRADYKLYADDRDFEPKTGKLESIENHMRNFIDCVSSRKTPISDVVSQHRSVSTCHLTTISMRLGRPLEWDPELEQFDTDPEANSMLRREQRSGFEIA